MTEYPAADSRRAVSRAAAYCGSSGPVRADPKIETPLATPASVSKPSINSLDDLQDAPRIGAREVGARAALLQQFLVFGDRKVANALVDQPDRARSPGFRFRHARAACAPRGDAPPPSARDSPRATRARLTPEDQDCPSCQWRSVEHASLPALPCRSPEERTESPDPVRVPLDVARRRRDRLIAVGGIHPPPDVRQRRKRNERWAPIPAAPAETPADSEQIHRQPGANHRARRECEC